MLSPDGRTIVFRVGQDNIAKLFVRRLDQLDATELAGTENALNPFFSPDGPSLGFFASGRPQDHPDRRRGRDDAD